MDFEIIHEKVAGQLKALKGLCQLESMRAEVMQITFNCQNSIVFNARLHVLCHLEGSEFREVNKRNGFR